MEKINHLYFLLEESIAINYFYCHNFAGNMKTNVDTWNRIIFKVIYQDSYCY